MKTSLSPIWTIAKNTYKEQIRDRLMLGILVVALLVTASSFFLGTISFDQNSRVIQNIGLASIHLFSLFILVFVSSGSMHHDLERRALYLLLPKPITRTHYLLGKYLGLILLLITTLLILGGLFSLVSLFVDRGLILGTVMVLSYSFLEISLLTALALLLSSFAAPLNASLYTLALFLIGHSSTALKEYAAAKSTAAAQHVIDFCYYILPNLDKFDIRQAVLYQVSISPSQVIWSLFYWIIYVALLLGLTILVLHKREV